MKKLIVLALSLLVLAGCSDARAQLSDPNTAVFSVGDQSLTKGDLYSFMMARDAGYYAINEANRIIFDQEVPVSDQMRAEAEETLNSYRSMFGDSFTSYLQSYGFADEEDYLNNSLLLSIQSQALTEKYINENCDTLTARYSPKKIRLMQFTDETAANTALEALKNGADFAETASANGSSVSSEETVATTQSSYATNVLAYLSVVTEPGLSEVIADDSAANFYIVQVTDTNPENFRDEVVSAIAAMSTISSESTIHYFEKYNFTVYDKTIYDQLSSNYSDYLVQDNSDSE